jgi:alpha-L-fucosidase
MDVNKEAIFGTRPWQVFGEGPASAGAAISAQGFNEGKGKPFTADDVRYTTKGKFLYAIAMGVPTKPLSLKTLGTKSVSISSISLLGNTAKVDWKQGDEALEIQPPANKPASDAAVVYKIALK